MATYQNNSRYSRPGMGYPQRSSCNSSRSSSERPHYNTAHLSSERSSAPCGNSESNTCSCRENRPRTPHMSDPLASLPAAMAYVPWQNWRDIYDIEQGFRCGTIFKELNKPFLWKGGFCR
ncbi:MAG: spore coat associated protein CotJA [Lachnospiraceae bacterium]|nr:spore coat associated protein CotJA [Lachnospiraceae bacterium]